MYDTIQTIRYMGNKNKLLDFIIPEIENITPKGDTICDLMAGTNCISYALKKKYKIITNDVQKYSECISNALIVNDISISSEEAKKDLYLNFRKNLEEKKYKYFYEVYSDTYFSERQCLEIDSLRFAIEKINVKYKKYLYLTALMSTMCKVQSSPGHFAQYMPKENKRIIPLRNMIVWDEFIEKCNDFTNIIKNKSINKAFNEDYKELLKRKEMQKVKTFYLDSPYSGEQYSRFYHILETITKYDCPEVSFKAKYRNDRFMSNFCYKKSVKKEFDTIINFCYQNNSNLVISYSNKGVISCEELEKIAKSKYNKVKIKKYNYKHSTQGKGSNSLFEYLFILEM